MNSKFWLLAAALALAPHPAFAGCDQDTIQTVSEDGDLIVLQSGASYDVDLGDQATASQWTENQDVLVCRGSKIINKDENGESIDVLEHQH
ncbi:MAG: hypothetical protein AB1508_08695 [Pseudomonadota bacterium]